MKSNSFALAGKILRVDLTSGKVWTEPTARYAEEWIGGRGINVWILFNEVKPWVTPFDPANRLIFGTGVLVGTLAPAATRLTIEAKSPVTGGLGSANSCGHFSPELKFAGYDHIVFQGRSRRPVYLWIDDNRVKIMDASHLWGKTTWEADASIKEELGDKNVQIASIGPAGENLVRAACIMINRARAAGRCGLGAVMGSKNLKAVAVRGSGSIKVFHQDEFMSEVDRTRGKIRKSPAAEILKAHGTQGFSLETNNFSFLPVRNFQDDYWESKNLEILKTEVFEKEYEVGRVGYLSCPICCSHFYKIASGPYAGVCSEGFEANDAWNFAGKLGIEYPQALIKLHAMCNEYGLDQDSASQAIAWAFECYQRGIITEKDTGGLHLEWGDHRIVVELLRKIALREGFGDILAEGSKRASKIVGRCSEKYAIHIKGQDSIEGMRTMKGWALGCVVSTRGGAHTRGAIGCEASSDAPVEVMQKEFGISSWTNHLSYENKAKLVVYYERLKGVVDSLNICLHMTNWESLDLLDSRDLTKLYTEATGKKISSNEMMVIGERIHNIEKAFNVLHTGFAREDDYPPLRFMEEQVKSGPFKGEYLPRDKWDTMLDEYYELHGYDIKTGWQTRRCLEHLDLKQIADELEREGRLAEDIKISNWKLQIKDT